MRFVSRNQIANELQSVKPVSALERKAESYHYTHLCPREFELLNYALFKASEPLGQNRTWDNVAITVRGPDSGRDILLFSGEEITGIVQCKRIEKSLSLPETFRELVKCILHIQEDESLSCTTHEMTYFLVLARDPANTVVDFFARPYFTMKDKEKDLNIATDKVLQETVAFQAIKKDDARYKTLECLSRMKYSLLRRQDLDEWMARETPTATRFFHHRILVDNSVMSGHMDGIKEQLASLDQQVMGVPFITDVDLKVVKNYIENIPDTHRLSFGLATLFGFPREMFAEDTNLKDLVGPFVGALTRIYGAYIEWMQQKVRDEAFRIADLPEVLYTVHPFARQIIMSYLTLFVGNMMRKTLSGNTIGDAFSKVTRWPEFTSEEELLEHVCRDHVEQGQRYLKGDYSNIVGEGDLLRKKLEIIAYIMEGITDDGTLEVIIRDGQRVLEPRLRESTKRLRCLCDHRPSIFLMGTTGIDSDDVLRKTGETLKALDEMRKRDQSFD